MIEYRCDRCGASLATKDDFRYLQFTAGDNPAPLTAKDQQPALCSLCMDDIKKFAATPVKR